MKKYNQSSTALNLQSSCYFLLAFSFFSSITFLSWSNNSLIPCTLQKLIIYPKIQDPPPFSTHLPSLSLPWNHLSFSQNPPQKRLNIALFVKRWPRGDRAGGLERHALTLHLALARRGHVTHVFTTSPYSSPEQKPPDQPNMYYHFSDPTPSGTVDQNVAWQQFVSQNSIKPFDVIHTESVGLSHIRARNLTNVAVSWHGIAYECVHSDIVQDLVRGLDEPRSPELHRRLADRLFLVIEEVKFFNNYAHHVATSDHVGDILKRIYMIPDERVHVILNGVDEEIFKKNLHRGQVFREKYKIPKSTDLVLGMSGRLVKDKGHPIMHEALKQIFKADPTIQERVYFLVAGDGPWGDRYGELGPNMLVLGALERPELSDFYNSIDVFVHPTLRAQGLDQTVLEAMISGKPVMVTRFASMTQSAIVSLEMGYTFSPTLSSLKETLYKVFGDGRQVLEKKGDAAMQRGLKLFTATKMAAAFERLFLCISQHKEKEEVDYCRYPLPSDGNIKDSSRIMP